MPENSHWDPGYTPLEVAVVMGGLPAPRLIGAVVRQGRWTYRALPAEFREDRFLVRPGEIAGAMGLPGTGDTPMPVREAAAALGWEVGFTTEKMADPSDPRVYMWIYT